MNNFYTLLFVIYCATTTSFAPAWAFDKKLIVKDTALQEARLFWENGSELSPAEADFKPYFRKFFQGPDHGEVLKISSDGCYLIVTTDMTKKVTVDPNCRSRIENNKDNFKTLYQKDS